MDSDTDDLAIKSIVSATTREPGVMIRLGDVYRTVSVETARAIAQWLIEAAEAALQDAFLTDWGQQVMELSDQQTVALLIEFRTWRQKYEENR